MVRAIPLHKEVYSEKKLEMPKICAFDIETEGLGGKFIIGALWTSDAYRMLFSDLDSFVEWAITHPEYRFLAHNASGYEFAYLYPLLFDKFANNPNCELIPTLQGDTRIVQIRIVFTDETRRTRRGKPTKTIIDLRDTLCLFNMSLEKVAKSFCPHLPKLKGNVDFKKETFNPNDPLHIEYLWRDCEIILEAYTKHWNDVVEVFKSPLGVTAGSTALKAFRTCIPEGHVYYRVNDEADEFIRKAYYGGWVNPGRSVGEWGSIASVDVNGAYAWQMVSHLFPVGSPVGTYNYDNSKIGFYQCDCTVPNSVYDTLGFNPIPRRDKEGLCWPTGHFETFISTPEIEYARSKGCIVNVICGYEFQRLEPVFDEFIKKCQVMEMADNFKYKPTIKGIRNSGYGKFGSKTEHKTIRFSHTTLDGYEPLRNTETGQKIPGIYVGEENQEADYMMPAWAALITAYERLYIMQYAEKCYQYGAKNVYCDTDSIKCDASIMYRMVDAKEFPIGNNYGEFKLEETCTSFLLLGGKCFFGDTGDDNKPLKKAKGIRNDELNIQIYKDGLEALTKPQARKKNDVLIDKKNRNVEFDAVESVMNLIKTQQVVHPVRRKRRITDIRNSFAWEYDNGRIYPKGYLQTRV